MTRCMIGKLTAKLLSLAIVSVMIFTLIVPVESYAASKDDKEKKGIEAEVTGEKQSVSEELKEEKTDEENSVVVKEEKKANVKTPKKALLSDILSITLKPEQVNEKAYKNKAGSFKVKFDVEWSDEEVYETMVKDGWKFTFTLKDIASGKDLKYKEDKVFTVKTSQTKGYSMTVTAEKEGEETQTFTSKAPKFKYPSKVKKVTANCPSNSHTVTIKWKKVSGAAGYYIYRNTKKSKPSKPIKKISGGSKVKYKDEKLKGKKTYYYWIQTIGSYKSNGEKYQTVSAFSGSDKAKVNKFLLGKIRTIRWYFYLKSNTKLYKSKTGSSVKKTLKKGTKVFIPFLNPRINNDRIYVTNYKGWVKRGTLRNIKGEVAYKNKQALDWTTEDKEEFVNKKGYSSSTSYLIWTNQYTQKVNVFKGKKGHWDLVRSMRCTTGTWDRRTGNSANLRIKRHQARRDKTSETGYRYYYINLSVFGNAFHSPAWRFGTRHCIKAVKRNLQPDTAGCVRMSVADSSYVYHLPVGTRVVIF